jgi:hypothetical protein
MQDDGEREDDAPANVLPLGGGRVWGFHENFGGLGGGRAWGFHENFGGRASLITLSPRGLWLSDR